MNGQSDTLRVNYSTGSRFAGGGNGNTSYHAVRGLHRHAMLARLICGSYRPTEIPADRIRSLGWTSRLLRRLAIYDSRNRLDYAYRRLYDRWAALQLGSCHVFHGWSGYCLETMERARQKGALTVLDRALAHPIYLNELLRDAYRPAGLKHHTPPAAGRVVQEIACADYVLIPSDFVRESFLSQGVPGEKLIQIPFGVDLDRFAPTASAPARPFTALFAGQVSLRKGVPTLLEAWKRLAWKDAELWLAGQQKLPPALRAQYRQSPGVRFLGHVAEIREAFQAADVFVFPSLAEGSALVTYEAMASGLPVIVTPNSGSVARHGIEGLIVPAGDADALAAGLEALRADESLRREMGRAARSRVQAYDWNTYGDRVAAAHQQLGGRG